MSEQPARDLSAEPRSVPYRPQSFAGAPAERELMRDDLDLAMIIGVVRRHVVLITGLALLLAIVVVVFALFQPRSYTATASFMPQGGSSNSAAIAGLAAQLGVGVSSDATQSPQFYVELLGSRAILEPVADAPYHTAGKMVSLADVLHVPAGAPAQRRANVVQALRARLTADQSLKTNVIKVSGTAGDPEIALQLVSNELDALSTFNVRTRQTQATEERKFTEQRLAEAGADLHAAEDRLQSFLQSNRNYSNASELRVQGDRLERDVTLRQTLYTTLAQSLEQAKIDEVRDTPVLTIIERPELPLRPDSRGIARRAIVALFAGAMVGVLLAFVLAARGRPASAAA